MNDYLKIKTTFFSLLTALSSAGCSIGTEVGNGVKPSPDPRDDKDKMSSPDESNNDTTTSDNGGKPTTTYEDSAKDNNRSSEKSNSPQSSSTPMPGAGNPLEVSPERLVNLVMNQCASPWSESYVPAVVSFVGGTSSAPAVFKWTFQSDTVSGISRLQWLAPGTSTHFTRKNSGGKTAYSIEIRDQASVTSPLSPLGANVTCSEVLVAPSDLPGSPSGSVEQVSANLSTEGLSAKIQWYTTQSGNSKSLKLIRITIGQSNIIYDFKPE